jgi:Sec-independent protein secretion pathway component TatC
MPDPIQERENKICCAGTAIATIVLFVLGMMNGIFFIFAIIAFIFGLYQISSNK